MHASKQALYECEQADRRRPQGAKWQELEVRGSDNSNSVTQIHTSHQQSKLGHQTKTSMTDNAA